MTTKLKLVCVVLGALLVHMVAVNNAVCADVWCQPIGASSADCNGGKCVYGGTIAWEECFLIFCSEERLEYGKCQEVVCTRNDQCPTGEICKAGLCGKPDGIYCATNQQCAANELCIEGFCSRSECTRSSDCPNGNVCVTQDNGLRKCEMCLCPGGYKCGVFLGKGFLEEKKICIKSSIPYPKPVGKVK